MAKNNSSYSEKEIATNLLVTLKHLKSEMNTFTQEASNEDLYNTLNSIYEEYSCLQRTVYEMMSAQGWYKMTPDTEKNITKAYNKFSNMESELS